MAAANRARLKLVPVGLEEVLLLRIVAYRHPGQQKLARSIIGNVSDDRVQCDGEVYRVRTRDTEAIARRASRLCDAVYDPGLEPGLQALPNPWPIPVAPARDRSVKPAICMARVRHPDLGDALAFHTPRYDDDFIIDFRRKTGGDASRWRKWREDFKVWAVADHYEDVVHAALDRHFVCYWDEFIAGEEWDVLEPPPDTRYPRRELAASDFAVLQLSPDCSREELNAAYLDAKAAYRNNDLDVDSWDDVEVAYERILRNHRFVKAEFEGREPVGPAGVIRLLNQWIADHDERSRWFHAFSHTLAGTPADLVQTPEGEERVRGYIQLMLTMVRG